MAGKWTRRGLATAFIAGVCTALAVPAFAYVSSASHSVSVAAGGQGVVSASCPAGQHVTLGGIGATLSLPLFGGPVVFPQQFFADATQTTWSVLGINGGASTGTLTSKVYCGPHPTRTVVTKTVSVASGGIGVATATCPAGKVVLGAGYKTPPTPPYPVGLINRMYAPTTTTVEVAYVHFATGKSASITAIAYCGDGPALTPVTAQISTNGNATSVPSVTATCPAAHPNLMWGGMWGQFPTSNGDPEVLPFSMSSPTKSTWKVAGFNPSSTTGFLRALAYCR